MPLDPNLGNDPQPPATMNADRYPPVEQPGLTLWAFGNNPNKSFVPKTMKAHAGKRLPPHKSKDAWRVIGP